MEGMKAVKLEGTKEEVFSRGLKGKVGTLVSRGRLKYLEKLAN